MYQLPMMKMIIMYCKLVLIKKSREKKKDYEVLEYLTKRVNWLL